MKIDAIKFGLAIAVIFAAAWVICTLFVVSMPTAMMQMTGHMVHANFGQMSWNLGWVGFIYGLVAWSVVAGIMGWGIAALYNRLVG